mmetsp:Transcript_27089/g.92492  ORF Transcript_27089/g.92492 Transcript_27089/m.92492 type:complete len:200 (+) Transcript_27089:73-672(+)
MSFTSSTVTSSATISSASWPCTWSITVCPSASLSITKSRLSTLGTVPACSASCSLSRSSASRYRSSSPGVMPPCASRFISTTASRVACSQSWGSQITVRVVTAQPSRPLSLWSSSIVTISFASSAHRALARNWRTLMTMRETNALRRLARSATVCTGSLEKTESEYCCSSSWRKTCTPLSGASVPVAGSSLGVSDWLVP